MSKWIIYTAFRHFRSKRREKGDTSTLLSIIGIISGVMTMITVIGVMNGFQGSKIDNLIEIGSSHIVLEPKGESLKLDPSVFNIDLIETWYKSSENITAISSERSTSLKGVQVVSLPDDVRDIDPKFKEKVRVRFGGEFNLYEENSIIVGSILARRLHARVGDTISLLSLIGESGEKFRPTQVEFTLTGIYQSGHSAFDEAMVFISNESANNYFSKDWVYKIKLTDIKRFKSVMDILASNSQVSENFNIKSWKDFNRSYYSALKNEKNMMTILIGLIFIVVGVNIYNSHRRSVYLRYEEISVLKTLGGTSNDIRLIYILEGFFVGFIGASAGVLLGLFITFNINNVFSILEVIINFFLSIFNSSVSLYGSQSFYLTEVPVRVYLNECIGVFLSALITSMGAAFFASKRISIIKPGEVIRNE